MQKTISVLILDPNSSKYDDYTPIPALPRLKCVEITGPEASINKFMKLAHYTEN